MQRYFVIILVFISISCSEKPENNIVAPKSISSIAEEYLNSALNIMQNNSINRYKIEWVSFRKNTFDYAGNAQSTKDTYDAIRFALKNLGDHHSFFIEPQMNSKYVVTIPPHNKIKLNLSDSSTTLLGIRIKENIGFIRIPTFSGGGNEINNFAKDIQNLIKKIDTSSIKGWIVDLRHNRGGNMWPMLAGVGPILGNGLVGKFVDPDTNVTNWYYKDGKAILENSTLTIVDNYYNLINSNPYVAALTDSLTASSGEAIVVAFKGRPKTKSFGNYTRGLSTSNKGFIMSDGAIIILTVSTMVDRNGNLYGNKIKPDEIVIGEFRENPTDNDNVVDTAINWLESNM